MFVFDKPLGVAAAALAICGMATASAAEPRQSTGDWLGYYARQWQETDWQQKGRFHAGGYMRPQDDTGWQARMRAMQGCVRNGVEAIPALLEALHSGDAPQRIFAAQTLGYLGPGVSSEPLVTALNAEADPAARLYLVDTLGMLGKGAEVDWDKFLKSESNRDVRRHVGYVQERDGEPLDTQVVERLKDWDVGRINTATVGQAAPDFVLSAAQGGNVRLSDYRGKNAVVLVFIYGDT